MPSYWWRWGLLNFLPRLSLSQNLPELRLKQQAQSLMPSTFLFLLSPSEILEVNNIG
jgi:hypothetical protein